MTAVASSAASAASEPAGRSSVLLGSRAAGSCPVKTHHSHDQTSALPDPEPGEVVVPAQLQHAREVEARLVEALIAAAPGLVVDLRLLADEPATAVESCLRAMTVGAHVIIGGTLPADRVGRRIGRPDVLVRGVDSADGRPTYHPVEVQPHKVLLATSSRRTPPAAEDPPPPAVHTSTFADPRPLALEPLPGMVFRLRSRESDLLQLAHDVRLLAAAGFAPDTPLAAVIGTDTATAEAPLLAWFDLSVPLVRTYSRSAPSGWRLRSVLERYDHEFALRLDVAAVARQRTGAADDPAPLVQPVVCDECPRCPWWERCRSELSEDDVSLRIGKGALDVREVLALRRLGTGTVTALAAADLTTLLPDYLPQVTHRSGAEGRLRVASRRARMLQADEVFARETSGDITFPGAEIEVDLDIESAADGRIYLWGFLLHDRRSDAPPDYSHVSAFTDLDEADELDLAREAFGWLRDLVHQGRSVRVYHYSAYEPSAIRALADRAPDDPLLAWAAAYAEAEFVDLYDVVKTHFFGVNGLGLKPIAQHAGFRWRDDDPGGLNSQAWFADAVHDADASTRDQARTRVLEYNEDDVTATHALRAWLRSPGPAR